MYDNMRPGVYSTYMVDSMYHTPRSNKYAAVVMRGNASIAGTLFTYTSYGEAAGQLGAYSGNEKVLKCVRLLFDSGVRGVYVAMISTNMASPLGLLESVDNIGIIVCEAVSKLDFTTLKGHLDTCGKNLRERLCFIGFSAVENAVEMAEYCNHERVVITSPAVTAEKDGDAHGIYGAAALAGAVLGVGSPVYNWNNYRLEKLAGCGATEESKIQSALKGGVTVLENRGGSVSCIRAVTTRTKTDGVEDATMRSLNTIMIIDDVLESVRRSLESKLSGLRVSAETVKAQVTVELSDKQEAGIIEDFSTPNVYMDPKDPSVCVVEIGFHAAHVLSQIRITAHIQV